MSELSQEDIQNALRAVLRDPSTVAPAIEPVIRKVVIDCMAEKFEKTLGINCDDIDSRLESVKDMAFLHETRIYLQSDEGRSELVAFRNLMRAVQATATGMTKTIVNLLLGGLVILGGLALKDSSALRHFFDGK